MITDIITFEIDTEKQREHSWQRDADRERNARSEQLLMIPTKPENDCQESC